MRRSPPACESGMDRLRTREKFVMVVNMNAIKTIRGWKRDRTLNGKMGSFARRSIHTNSGSVDRLNRNKPETRGWVEGYPDVVVRLAPMDKEEIYHQRLAPSRQQGHDSPSSSRQSSLPSRSV